MSENAIKQLVQVYFESMYESSADKVRQAFHPSARITGYLQGDFSEMTVEQFAGLVESQQPSAADEGTEKILEIVSIDIAGSTAVARVRDAYLGLMFLDTLSLIKIDDQWSIYNKLYHVEGPVEASVKGSVAG